MPTLQIAVNLNPPRDFQIGVAATGGNPGDAVTVSASVTSYDIANLPWQNQQTRILDANGVANFTFDVHLDWGGSAAVDAIASGFASPGAPVHISVHP